jgi:hypothetical protein
MDQIFEEIMQQITQDPVLTKEEFMDRCPGIFPTNDQETEWFEEWIDSNPKIKQQMDEELRLSDRRMALEHIRFKIDLRIFLEDNAPGSHGRFSLEYSGGIAKIQPEPPNGEEFRIEVVPKIFRENGNTD